MFFKLIRASYYLIFAGFLVVLGGCFFQQESYLKPIGTGIYLKSSCGGPDQNLAFEVEKGLAASVVTNKKGDLYLKFFLGEGHRLKFVIPNVKILIGSKKTNDYPFSYLTYSNPRSTEETKFPVNVELQGYTTPKSEQYFIPSLVGPAWLSFGIYTISISPNLSKSSAREILVQWPKILFDGKTIDIPAIPLKHVEEAILYSVNC